MVSDAIPTHRSTGNPGPRPWRALSDYHRDRVYLDVGGDGESCARLNLAVGLAERVSNARVKFGYRPLSARRVGDRGSARHRTSEGGRGGICNPPDGEVDAAGSVLQGRSFSPNLMPNVQNLHHVWRMKLAIPATDNKLPLLAFPTEGDIERQGTRIHDSVWLVFSYQFSCCGSA